MSLHVTLIYAIEQFENFVLSESLGVQFRDSLQKLCLCENQIQPNRDQSAS